MHNQCLEWQQFILFKMRSSPIGYPSKCWPDAIGSQGQAKAIIPDVMMPKPVKEIDNAMKTIPPELGIVITKHYIEGEPVSRRKLNEGLIYIAGVLRR